MKRCTKCRRRLPLSNFRRCWGRSSDGLRPLCAGCQRRYEMKWRKRNKNRLKTARQARREKERIYRLEYDAKNRGRLLVMEAGRRCKRKGVLFDLHRHLHEIETRIQKGYCELTGLPFDFYTRGMAWNSPSLDRIDPAGGYTYRNIRIVCFGMNAALGNWGEAVLQKMLRAWLRRRT